MRHFILISALFPFILVSQSFSYEGYGTEGEDYEERALIIKFGEDIEVIEEHTEGGVIFHTGIPVLDGILLGLDTYQFERITPLPDIPKDHPKGYWTWDDLCENYNLYGIGRYFVLRYNDPTPVMDIMDQFNATNIVIELIEPNGYAEECGSPPPGYDPDIGPDDIRYPSQWYLKDN